jgi:hypothetical protein
MIFGTRCRLGNNPSMARYLILLVTILAAGMFAVSSPAQILSGPQSLEWNDWSVKINHLDLKGYDNADSIFVYLDMTVTNMSHKGSSFIPQNILKIIVGENEFDAADLDGIGESYLSNIEPTLDRERKCRFELPRSLVKRSFVIRFAGLFAETKDLNISIAAPTPTPSPETKTAPAAPPATTVVSAITGNRWTAEALIVSGTLTNSSAVAVQITGIDAKGFNRDQEMVTRGSDFTIVHDDLAPGEVVNFKVALKDDTKQVKFVKVLPTWTP